MPPAITRLLAELTRQSGHVPLRGPRAVTETWRPKVAVEARPLPDPIAAAQAAFDAEPTPETLQELLGALRFRHETALMHERAPFVGRPVPEEVPDTGYQPEFPGMPPREGASIEQILRQRRGPVVAGPAPPPTRDPLTFEELLEQLRIERAQKAQGLIKGAVSERGLGGSPAAYWRAVRHGEGTAAPSIAELIQQVARPVRPLADAAGPKAPGTSTLRQRGTYGDRFRTLTANEPRHRPALTITEIKARARVPPDQRPEVQRDLLAIARELPVPPRRPFDPESIETGTVTDRELLNYILQQQMWVGNYEGLPKEIAEAVGITPGRTYLRFGQVPGIEEDISSIATGKRDIAISMKNWERKHPGEAFPTKRSVDATSAEGRDQLAKVEKIAEEDPARLAYKQQGQQLAGVPDRLFDAVAARKRTLVPIGNRATVGPTLRVVDEFGATVESPVRSIVEITDQGLVGPNGVVSRWLPGKPQTRRYEAVRVVAARMGVSPWTLRREIAKAGGTLRLANLASPGELPVPLLSEVEAFGKEVQPIRESGITKRESYTPWSLPQTTPEEARIARYLGENRFTPDERVDMAITAKPPFARDVSAVVEPEGLRGLGPQGPGPTPAEHGPTGPGPTALHLGDKVLSPIGPANIVGGRTPEGLIGPEALTEARNDNGMALVRELARLTKAGQGLPIEGQQAVVARGPDRTLTKTGVRAKPGAWGPIGSVPIGSLKKITPAAVAGLGVGAAFLGPTASTSEAALPLPAGTKSAALAAIREAPTRVITSQPLGERAKAAIYEGYQPIVKETKAVEATGYEFPPNDNPRFLLSTVMRGGGDRVKAIATRLRDALEPINSLGLQSHLDAWMTLAGSERAWRVVRSKASAIEAQANEALRAGNAGRANRLRSQGALMTRNIDRQTVAPMGLTEAEIPGEREALRATMTPEEFAAVDRATNEAFAFGREILKRMYDNGHGIISKADYDTYLARGNDYFPLYRIMALYDDRVGQLIETQFLSKTPRATRAKMALRQENVIEGLEGSERPNISPIVALTKFAYAAMDEIASNGVAKRMIRAFNQAAEAGKSELRFVPVREAPSEEALNAAHQGVVAYLDNGQPKYFLTDRDVADAMNLIDVEGARSATNVLRGMKGFFHAMAASANPVFALVQIVKDPFSAMLLPNWQKAGGRQPVHFANIWGQTATAEMFLRHPRIRASLDAVTGGAASRVWKRHEALIGKAEEYGAIGPQLGRRPNYVKELTGRDPNEGFWQKAVTNPMDWLQAQFLEPIEKATKLATFEGLTRDTPGGKPGLHPREAAFETRKYGGSPDFFQYGRATKDWSDYYMFLNPQIQGIGRTLERFAEDPGKLRAWTLAMTAGLTGLYGWNSQFKDPATGQPELFTIPENERQQNVIVFVPDGAWVPDALKPQLTSRGDLRRPYLKIPMPYEFQQLAAPIVAGIQFFSDDPSFDGWQVPLDILNTVLPGGVPLEHEQLARTAMRRGVAGLTPVLKWPIEQFGNTNFFTGAPIVGSRIQSRPPEYQYTRRTDPIARQVAGGLSRALGPEAAKQLTAVTSPDRLEHTWRTFMPGLGELAASVARPAVAPEPLIGQAPLEQVTQIPGLGLFAKRLLPSVHSQPRISAMAKLYQTQEETKKAASLINDLAARDPAELRLALESNPDLLRKRALNPVLTRLVNALSALDDRRDRLVNDAALPLGPVDRQQALAALAAQERALFAAAEQVLGTLP